MAHFCNTTFPQWSFTDRVEIAFAWMQRLCNTPSATGDLVTSVRNVFKTLALIFEGDPRTIDLAGRFRKIESALGDIKCAADLLKVPRKIQDAVTSAHKTAEFARIVYRQWHEGEPIDKWMLFKVITHAGRTVEKTISAASKAIFNPLFRLHYHFDLGEHVSRMSYVWSIITLTGKGIKIIYLSGEIIDGKEVCFHVVEIAIAISEFVIRVVKLSGLRVHPAVTLVIGICDNLVDLYDLVYKVYQRDS